MGEVHRLLREHGRDAVKAMDVDRSVVEAATAYLSSEEHEIGYLYSGWAQAALPHKRLADDASWHLQTERVALIVQPGLKMKPGDETPVSVGVPYGSRARLIMLYLQTEALRRRCREIELGRSLHDWLRRMQISIGGKSMKDVRDQAERISRCRLTFQISSGSRMGLVNQNIVDHAMFVVNESANPNAQGALFVETAKLSESFFEQLQRHPVPIEETAIQAIANNSMAIDIYIWLAYRLHALGGPTIISWRALHAQFGKGIARVDHFREQFRKTLALACAVYEDADVSEDCRGVTLRPSRPPVAPRQVGAGGRSSPQSR